MLSGLAELIDKQLPQYQCGRCGQPDCAHYAQALAARQTTPDLCAPGGGALAKRLAAMSGVLLRAGATFDGENLQCARVVEEVCIGCARCLIVCPLDALIGAPKFLHAVLPTLCSGCGVCIPACPVDCIVLELAGREWTDGDAAVARSRYHARLRRLVEATPVKQRQTAEKKGAAAEKPTETPGETRKRAIAKALATARARRAGIRG